MAIAAGKRLCTICEIEHKVGEACPECGWHQEKEEALAKAEQARKKLREGAGKAAEPKKKGFFD